MWGIKLGDLMSLIYITYLKFYMRSMVAKKWQFLGPNVVILDPKWPCKGPYSKLFVNMSCGVSNSVIR